MLTDSNNRDNLENYGKQYRNFSEAELAQAFNILWTVINSTMARKNTITEIDQQASTEIDHDEFAWHCYLCGHTWIPQEKTNADPSEAKCARCDRYEFNRVKFLCRHDPNCPRCLKRKQKEIKTYEKLLET